MDLLHFFFTGSFDSANVGHIENVVRSNSINYTIWASLILIGLVGVAAMIKKQNEFIKWLLFISMVGLISLNTVYLAGSTIYKNQRSITKGPVHWHADIEIWNCGSEVNLKDPTGWSNKIGTPVFHEHNDKKLHVEGVILERSHATLGYFFDVIDGKLNYQGLTVPTNEGQLTMRNGEMCNNAPGMIQVFVYKTEGNKYWQEKVANPEEYMLSPYSAVPAGDCIIIEFDAMKDKTDHLCQSYKVQEHLGKISER